MAGFESQKRQKTIDSEGFISGVGLFTGVKVSLKVIPAPPNHGIVFRRVDLPSQPLIPATLRYVVDAIRCTRLGLGESTVNMVEHLLSTISAKGIDNLLIEVDGPEIVAGDGSSNLFVELFETVGIKEQDAKKRVIRIEKPIYFSENGVQLIALPSDKFQISYTLHYPKSTLVGSQFYSLDMSWPYFKQEISSCRTFSFYEEILPFIERGIIKGGGLENALVIKEDKVMNPGGVRFTDEMVRHKILDLNGDLSLIGASILGHIISIRSGHSSNIAFAKMIANLENNQ